VWFAQVLLGMVQFSDSSAVELAVPVVRALAGERGVQTGPALGSLVTFLALQARITATGREVASHGVATAERDDVGPLDRWLERTVFSGAAYLSAFGAVLPATVVLRRRSPLWGLALWPLVRLIGVTALAAEGVRLAKLHPADEPGVDAAGR